MNYEAILSDILSFLVIIPCGLICYLPMRHRMRFQRSTMLCLSAIFLVLTFGFCAIVSQLTVLDGNPMFFIMLVICFFYYNWTIGVHISKSSAVFCNVIALMSILSNYAAIFDASRHPTLGIADSTLDYTIFQFGAAVLALAVLLIPGYFYASRIIDMLDLPNVWFLTIPFSLIILAINLFLRPQKYETYYVNNVASSVKLVLAALLAVWVLLQVFFYFIVMGMLEAAEIESEKRVLELQEAQYIEQKKYMDATAKERHDFRQMVRTLKTMTETADIEAVRAFLDTYLKEMPVTDVANYVTNNPVNALLNYYARIAKEFGIVLNWDTHLDSNTKITNVDLCGMIGNILDNAINACQDVTPGKRFIRLFIGIREDHALHIEAANSYSGTLKRENGHYATTHNGNGIGLGSIESTAARYNGSVTFEPSKTEELVFTSHVVLPEVS